MMVCFVMFSSFSW